jgi:hypothetical protein
MFKINTPPTVERHPLELRMENIKDPESLHHHDPNGRSLGSQILYSSKFFSKIQTLISVIHRVRSTHEISRSGSAPLTCEPGVTTHHLCLCRVQRILDALGGFYTSNFDFNVEVFSDSAGQTFYPLPSFTSTTTTSCFGHSSLPLP